MKVKMQKLGNSIFNQTEETLDVAYRAVEEKT